MFFELDDNQLELQSILRTFLAEASPEQSLVRRITECHDDGSDLEIFRRLCTELDVLGATVPQNRGGSGVGLVEQFVIFRELGRALYGGPFFASVLAAEVLVAADLQSECDAILADLIEGRARGAVLGLSHEGASTVAAIETSGSWHVSGHCRHVFGAAEATVLLLFANTQEGLACFVVDDVSSVSRTPFRQLDLSRSAAHVELSGVRVRPIGTLQSAATARERTLAVAALAIAAEQVGVAEHALQITVGHAKLRKQFGVPIGSFQAVKHRCADSAVSVEAAKSTGLHAAWAVNHCVEPHHPWTSLAKSVCVETSVKVTASAIQVLGGLGFTWEHPIHLYYRRAIASRQSFGSTRAHREVVAARLFGDG